MEQPERTYRSKRGKRASDGSLPEKAMKFKRPKAAMELQDFNDVDQLVLRAAALILKIPMDRLLSLPNPSTTSSRDAASERLEMSSNSSSNNQSGDYTPPDIPESMEQYRPGLVGQHSQSFPEHSGSSESSSISFFNQPVQAVLDYDLAGIGDIDTNMNTFTVVHQTRQEVYPTPPDSQYSQDQMTNQDLSSSFNLNNTADNETWIGLNWPLGPPAPAYNQEYTPHQHWDSHFVQNLSGETAIPSNHNTLGASRYDDNPLVGLTRQVVQGSGPFVPNLDGSGPQPFSYLMEEDMETKAIEKIPGSKGKRRGPFKDINQREETGLTRKLKACVRCSMQRIRCIPDPSSPEGVCKTCIQAAQTRTRWLPCLRYNITDSELLDNAKCPRSTWTSRWKKMEMVDITKWASDEVKSIDVTQGVGGKYYTLKVRKFVPVDGDALGRRWVYGGQHYEYDCAPYAVADMREAGRVLSEFSENTLTTAIPFWIKGDTLMQRTYKMAYRYSLSAERDEDRELLKCTLRLWGASRMMSRAAHICGEEILGMKRRDFGPSSPSTGKILMPPVFSAQMEIIFVAMILEPTKKEILSRLKALVQENSRRSWLAIYLCIFLLLHSCALLTARDRERGILQGSTKRFYRPSVIDELHNGAKILLAYFHYCNRGSYPLHMDWTSEDQVALTELKPEQIDFLRETVKDFEKKAPHFRDILDNDIYEDEYYFIAQLYERDWKPRHTV